MSSWKIIMPTAATNLVLNPSAETTANFAGVDSATVTRSTARARFGDYSYKIVSGGTNRGISLTTGTMANAIHYVTFYAFDNISVPYVSLDAGANGVLNVCTVIGGSTGNWVRWGFAVSAAQANGNATVRIYNPQNETWYIDAVQVEQSTYWTTYIDGNRAGPIYGEMMGLYGWNGHSHASTSFRAAQERTGGRVMDLEDDYGLKVQQMPGAGMPTLQHNQQGLSLQPGSAFQSTKTLPRQLTLVAETHNTSMTGYHSERKALINLVKPDGVRGSQPFILGYAGANSGKTVWGKFRYSDGLGLGDFSGGSTYLENHIPIQLLGVSPYWQEDNRETATLGFFETLTGVNRVMARIDGVWQKLGTGFNGTFCDAIAYDPTTGRTYYGGNFTTANGVTVNRICYWNPTTATFVAMDSGVGGAAKKVTAIAVAPNGDVWVAGDFTTVGAAATAAVGLAKWTLATGAWSVPTATATSFVSIYALAIDGNGNLYGGGDFLNYSGNAACDYIFQYTPAGAFASLGTGMNGVVDAMAVWMPNNKLILYVGGAFTTGNGVTLNRIGYWREDLATFRIMTGGLDSTVSAIAVASNGDVYAGGLFANALTPTVSLARIGRWNGIGWSTLGGGSGGQITTLYFGSDGLLYAAGSYTTIGPFTTEFPGVWNGSSWTLLDLHSATTFGTAYAFLVLPNGDLYIGTGSTTDLIVGSNTASAAIVATNTVAVFPNFTLLGPTSGTLTLKSISNLSSNQVMYFDLVINLGETVKISLQPGAKQVVSSWRGVISSMPLPTSDFANFQFLPTRADGGATNNIKAFCTGTVTGALFVCHWSVDHWSADGAAA